MESLESLARTVSQLHVRVRERDPEALLASLELLVKSRVLHDRRRRRASSSASANSSGP
jgi:hypothetical protein